MINIRKSLLGTAAVIFVLIEGCLFYLIHFNKSDFDINLHYACIIVAAIFSLVTLIIELVTVKKNGESTKDVILSKSRGNFIRVAMLCTLLADYFLVAKDEINRFAGVAVFIGTQFFFFLHILANDDNKRWRMANIIVRSALSVAIVIGAIIVLGKDVDSLAIISVIYYANLCTNAIFAHRIGKGGIMLTIGLILFALCDVNVGLSVLDSLYGGFPEGSFFYDLLYSGVDLVWIFYIPSQTLIPLTLLSANKTKKLGI